MKSTRKSLRLAFMADTHELHREVDVPVGDILFFAGDATMFSRSAAAALDFDEWLGELQFRRRVVAFGNHDSAFDPARPTSIRLQNATVLTSESAQVAGLNVWGSPVTPLMNGAFAMPSANSRRELYSIIPLDTDILITHSPPYGILDGPPGTSIHEGCRELLAAVKRVKPLIHCFGHVHAGYGVLETADTTFVNAALLGEELGELSNVPIVIDLPSRSARASSRRSRFSASSRDEGRA